MKTRTEKQSTKKRQSFTTGSMTGFIAAFVMTLLFTPVNGKTFQKKTLNQAAVLKNAPTKAVAAYRGRQEKFKELGRSTYEQWTEEKNALKEEAKRAARRQ
ncbi:hypothetical protein SAMN05192534_1402 [Alteribacillus persepolensis]|uniref:Uncharacterized protein n=1 Tax=Alteribacillus persepolensis TaxID=568899 RepID=A0A1G8K1Q3_9BACI|nr:hypothetical protein [Alteribacillus persepolensis]SDI37309.1 hypothetical protein SAMN05192534_1402 [Alteribacillus persepolensis]